jgi:hypothetical protein
MRGCRVRSRRLLAVEGGLQSRDVGNRVNVACRRIGGVVIMARQSVGTSGLLSIECGLEPGNVRNNMRMNRSGITARRLIEPRVVVAR